MKPYKVFGMSIYTLIFFTIIANGKHNFEEGTLNYIIFDTVFTFIFPAFIFFISWLFSYIRKSDDDYSILRYYVKVLLNIALPYFLCMIPYAIYNFGVNNLNFIDFIKLLINGNIVDEFTYMKSILHLAVLYPIFEYFVKLDTKKTCIISLAISIIFNMLHINNFIYTDVFNYLIYMVLGISFTYNSKEINLFYRNKKDSLVTDLVFVGLLVFITKFETINFLNPIPELLYNLVIILILTNIFLKNKVNLYNDRKYMHESFVFDTPIVGVSIFLLSDIVFKLINTFLEYSMENFPQIYIVFAVIIFIAYLFLLDRMNKSKLKRKTKIIRKIDQTFTEYK